MVKKGFIMVTLALVLVMALVVGCSQPAATPVPTTSAPVPTTSAPAPTSSAPTATVKPSTAPTTAAPTATVAVKPIELTVTHIQPVDGLFSVGIMQPWAKQVEQASKGRLKLNVYPMETFAKIPDTYTAVSNGLVDIALTYSGFSPGRFPRGTVMQLPSAPWTVDSAQSSVLLQRLFEGGYISDELTDVKMLWCFSNASASRFHFTKSISTIGDLKGKKIRVAGTVVSKMTEALGAVPVALSPGDVYTSLDRGVIDAASFPYEAAVSYKLNEVAKYHLTEAGTADYFFVVMNKDKFNSLPADLQKVIMDLSGQSGALFTGKTWLTYDDRARGIMKAANDTFVEFSAADHQKWLDTVKPVWDWWLADMKSKNVDGQKILDAAQKIWAEIKDK